MDVFQIILLIEVGVIAVVNLLGAIPQTMILLGLVIWVIGFLTGIGILTTIGIILVVIGLVLLLLGMVNRPVAGRKFWY